MMKSGGQTPCSETFQDHSVYSFHRSGQKVDGLCFSDLHLAHHPWLQIQELDPKLLFGIFNYRFVMNMGRSANHTAC